MLAKVRLVISKHSRPADLRSHLILLVLATMLPLLVFAVVMIVRLGKEERATFERGATEQTRALLTAVDTKLKSSVATLEALATLRELDTGDLRGVYDVMTRTLKSQPDWFTIHLADPSGQQILNLIRPLGSDLPMTQERQSFEVVLRTSKPAIGSVVIGRVTKQPEFSVRVPVMRDDIVKYVLSAVVRPQSISQLLLAQKLPPDWNGGVLDGNRRIVARTIEPERNVGQLASTSLRDALDRAPEGWFYGTNIEGWETYTPYNRSAFSGWTVALAIPAALVEASLRRSFLFVAGFGLILLALGITLAWFFSSRTRRSIESLSRMSENLGLGKGAGATTTAATDFPIAEVESVREALLSASRLIQERSAERDRVEQALARQAEALRENQARFSGVINSAMDAVIALDAAQRVVVFNLAAEQMFGCVAAEALGSSLDRFIPPRFREAHRGHIEKFGRTGVTSRRMGVLGALSGFRANGEEFPIEASISQMEVGGENFFTVILRDITERKQTEHRRDVTYAITQILAESPSLDDATPRILKTIGQKLDWEVGDLWTADSDANVLRCVKVWHDPSLIVDKFVSVSYERTFTPGVGLPGRVWTSLKPAWIADVTKDDNFPRAPFAVEAGLHAGFAFPILFGAKFLGVMEFFSREIRKPNDALLVLFDSIGSQIGQFMERKRAEEALREADRRKDEFLAMLGHELRNPLGVINTAACLLPTDGPPDPELAGASGHNQAGGIPDGSIAR